MRLRRPSRSCRLAAVLLGAAGITFTQAYTLDPNSTDSITSIAKQIVADTIDNYYFGHLPGNEPGILPQPYYWWEGGALMGTLISYWHYTNDTKYVNMTSQALLAQVGEYNDYMPKAQVMNEGNDDQGFWGMAVMAAAEYKFPDPPKDKPQWLALAQAVFNTQASRWESDTCGGGLRWQIFTWNKGFDYKNTISQGCFFNVAARLALYTGNSSYAAWADKIWDWTRAVGFIDGDYNVFDGAHVPQNCTNIVPYQWSYNHGSFMHGVAAMYNYSRGAEQVKWRNRLEGMLNKSSIFFINDTWMYEVPCETVELCNVDQQSFKAYLSRWMASMTKWAPWTYERIMPKLRTSAVGAVKQCTAGANGRMCGLKWYNDGQNDGLLGLGQQMAALEVTLALLATDSKGPVTSSTGGTSEGDPSAGGGDMGFKTNADIIASMPEIKPADRAGAYILTILALLGLVAGMVFVLVDEADGKSWPQRLSDLRRTIIGTGTALAAAGGVLRKSQQFSNGEKGGIVSHHGVVAVGVLSDDDGMREKRASSRIILDLPAGAVDPHSPLGYLQTPTPTTQAPPPALSPSSNMMLHRKSKSLPTWEPERGLAAAAAAAAMSAASPTSPGAGFRRSATQQIRRNSLRKKSASDPRPASMAI